MTKKQAKSELNQIMSQKTVRISRLKRILDALDYPKLERDYINASHKIKRQKDRLRYLETRGKQ